MSETRLTNEMIQKIKNRDEGWRDCWDAVCDVLVGPDGRGTLFQAVRRYEHCRDENRIEAIASYIMDQYHSSALRGTLFVNYDAEKSDGNVMAYLCGGDLIRTHITHFDSNNLRERMYVKNGETLYYDAPVSLNVPRKNSEDGTERGDLIPDKRRWGNILSSKKNEGALSQALSEKRLVLQFERKARFGRILEYAGLQTYPLLDRTNGTMSELCGRVVELVREFFSEPEREIEREHDDAQEEIAQKEAALEEARFHEKSQSVSRALPQTLERNERRYNALELRKYFYPLRPGQVARLYHLSENNVSKIKSRYCREYLPHLLPLSHEEETKLSQWIEITEQEGDDE